MRDFTKRQKRIFGEAEREVEFAISAVEEAELELENAKAVLRHAKRQLSNLEEMGDMV